MPSQDELGVVELGPRLLVAELEVQRAEGDAQAEEDGDLVRRRFLGELDERVAGHQYTTFPVMANWK